MGRLTDHERIDPDGLGDVLELGWAEIVHGNLESRFHLPIGVFGETDRPGRSNALESRRDIDRVSHQVAVALLEHVADMDANAELDTAVWRHACIALDHSVLHFDSAAHRVDHAAKLGERPIAGALEHTSIVHGDGRIDQITAKRAQPRQSAILVRAGKPTEPDDVGGQDRCKFPFFCHWSLCRRAIFSTTARPMRFRQLRSIYEGEGDFMASARDGSWSL